MACVLVTTVWHRVHINTRPVAPVHTHTHTPSAQPSPHTHKVTPPSRLALAILTPSVSRLVLSLAAGTPLARRSSGNLLLRFRNILIPPREFGREEKALMLSLSRPALTFFGRRRELPTPRASLSLYYIALAQRGL